MKYKGEFKIENLTGMNFGKWTVNYQEPKNANQKSREIYWNCTCKCGVNKKVLGKYLKTGKSTSCGCSKRKDLTGQKFGELIVVEMLYDYKKRANGTAATYCKCKCSCGNTPIILASSLPKLNGCIKCKNIRNRKDYTSVKFGKLTVTKMLYNYIGGTTYCLCDCQCGTKNYLVRMNGLITGNTSSCGCLTHVDLIGKKYGKLLVIEKSENKTHSSKQNFWTCKCDCGQVCSVPTYSLRSGHTQSCGCIFSEKTSSFEEVIKATLNSLKIPFQTQKTFNDCIGIGKKKLRFDFYIQSLNILIEYDGKQHFEPIEYFGGEKAFLTLRANDMIKNNYCKINKIPLFRIKYTLSKDQVVQKVKEIIFHVQESRNDHSDMSDYVTYASDYYLVK